MTATPCARRKSETRQRRALVGVRLLPSEHEELQKLAATDGTTSAAVLRAALQHYLGQRAQAADGLIRS